MRVAEEIIQQAFQGRSYEDIAVFVPHQCAELCD